MFKTLIAVFVVAVLSLSISVSSIAIAEQSAIERALESEQIPTKLDKELMEDLNILRGTIDTDDFVAFLERVRNNSQLETVIRNAKEAGVLISVTFHFSTGPAAIYVDGETTNDDKITNHIKESISEALAKEQLRTELEQPASELGITQGSIDIYEFASFIERANSNPELLKVLKKVKDADIRMSVTFHSSTGHRLIYIDVNQTDDEIIKYILGK